MTTPQQIIVRPVVTEKSTDLQSQHNKYVFEVVKKANKIEIRKAVEMVFGVRVSDVRTMVVRGDVRRVGRFFGRRPFWKKAIVTLHDGDSIDFYGEQPDQSPEKADKAAS
jgi:large subunit ribosomal protein L23